MPSSPTVIPVSLEPFEEIVPPATIANPNTDPRRYSRAWFRFFEILPGALVWIALISPFILSIYYPLWVTVFVLLFDVYWLTTSLDYGRLLLTGYFKFKQNLKTDWLANLRALDTLSAKELQAKNIIDWNEVYQAIILTTYKESLEILDTSIASILDNDFPMDRVFFCLATEERAGEPAQERAAILKEKYGHKFACFMVSVHPDNIVGEVKAKGANAAWAAKGLVKEMQRRNICYRNVVVSTADADSRFPKHYLTRLTYLFVTTPDRLNCAFQPVALYFNNIWDAPMLSRIMAFSTTFWQLMESVRDYRLITFATHAMSLQTLVDIDFWDTSIVNEDSRQFFRSFFHYNGKFRNVPMFIPIYMDAVFVGKLSSSLRNLYLQQQRWAYGVEHFPYIMLESWRRRNRIPFWDLGAMIWRAFMGTFSWATASFFITVVGWLPILLNHNFRNQVLASNFPVVTKYLLCMTWVGLLISSAITLRLLSLDRQRPRSLRDTVSIIVQWAMVPIASIFYGAVPSIDAQTRLMLGKYIGFRVTEKVKT
jgi:hypothetical protein